MVAVVAMGAVVDDLFDNCPSSVYLALPLPSHLCTTSPVKLRCKGKRSSLLFHPSLGDNLVPLRPGDFVGVGVGRPIVEALLLVLHVLPLDRME